MAAIAIVAVTIDDPVLYVGILPPLAFAVILGAAVVYVARSHTPRRGSQDNAES